MSYLTLEELVQNTLQEIVQVPGTSVDIYSQDRIASAIIANFEMLFDEFFWHQYTDWYTWTLDGSTGRVTNDISSVLTRYEDIDKIRVPNREQDLQEFSDESAPAEFTGTTPLFYMSDAIKVFKIVPPTSTGDVYVRCRTKPLTIVPTTEIKVDNLLLKLMTAWQVTTDDNANEAAESRLLQQTKQRYQQIHQYFGSKSRSVFAGGDAHSYPQGWF